jgi:hypothetical protein
VCTATFFQVTGTPSAILIDEEGNVASKVKVGGPDVMKLIKTTHAKARVATR